MGYRVVLFNSFLVLFILCAQAFAVPTSLTYQGRIIKSDGSALEYNNVAFIFKIMDPTGQCLLYQEQSNPIDMTGSGGVFDVPIGLGSVSYPSNGTTTIIDVFDNTNALPCSGGGTYNPVNTDVRLLRVSFYDGGGWRQISPDNTVRTVPFASYSKSSETAKKLGTNVASDFLLKAGLPTCGAGTFLTWNGSALTCGAGSGANGGTVTDVIAGTGLNVGAGPGGTINASGTLNVDVGTTTGKIVQVAASNKLPTIDGSNLTNITAANINGSVAIANGGTGQSSKSAAFDALSPTTTKGDLVVNNGSSNVRVGVGGNGQYLQADSSQASGVKWASVTDTLSGLGCGSNDIPYWNGSAWACRSSSSTNVVSAMILRDASGNFAANQGTLNTLILDNGAGSNISVATPVAFTSWQLKLPATAGSANQVLQTDGSGNTTWASVSSQWTTSVGNIYYNSGKVGIGTTSPNSQLDVVSSWTAANFQTTQNGITSPAIFTAPGGGAWGFSADPYIKLFNSNTANGSGFSIFFDGLNNNPAPVHVAGIEGAMTNNAVGATAGILAFGTSTAGSAVTERMRINEVGNVGVGTTAPAAKLDVAGDVKVGNSSAACNATTKGSIRYNDTTSVLEFCNGSAWNLVQAAACSDATPNVFAFSNQASQTTSTLVTSDIVQVSGINCSVPVQISGLGSPQYRICSDLGCSTIVQDWTSNPSTITSGQYMQVKQTTDVSGGVTTQATVIVGSGASVWSVSTTGDCSTIPTTYPAIGTICGDGTVYAGLSSDGNVPLYTTRCDAGLTWDGANCTGSASTLSWNNGTGPFTVTGVTGSASGQSNTATLVALADGGSPYIVANFCKTLNVNGHTDWYLPSIDELSVLYLNRGSIRNFDLNFYWSSTEIDSNYVRSKQFNGGGLVSRFKNVVTRFRCIRR